MVRPLVISYSYLRERTANGQIQRVFWEYLYDKGIRPTIICRSSKDIDNKELKCKVIETQQLDLLKKAIGLTRQTIWGDIGYLPDSEMFSWAKFSAIKKAKKEATSGKYDYIYSNSLPCSSHLIALEAKKVSGLPWIASFYDPWFDNPYRQIKNRKLRERDRRYEASIAENADVILHISHAVYNQWVERYGDDVKGKMFMLPVVFNQFEKFDMTTNTKGKFIISHIGTLFPGRDSVDFLKSLKLLIEKHPEIKSQIELNYVGTITDKDREFVESNDLISITHFAGYLSERECKEYFEKTDLFIAIDGKNESNIFFPSKIIKYFYYEKPILGLTPSGSELQFELNRSHNFCFENEDYEGISSFLLHAIKDRKYPHYNNKEYWRNFTMEVVCPKYNEIVNNLINKNEYNSK